jgi:adenylate cyclase
VTELFVMNGICQGTVFFLPEVPTAVGRSSECQVQIADPWISSMHAMFERRGPQLWLVDLESRNGTWVDDTRVREAPLAPGSKVRFGKTLTELREGQTPRSIVPLLNEHGTIVRYLADLQAEAHQSLDPEPQRDTDPSALRATQRASPARRQVAVLHDVGRALVDAPDLDACLAKILLTVAGAVRAERATLLLTDEHGRMVPRATHPPGSPARTSDAVMAAATRSRAGLLTIDALQDLRFTGSQSIVAQGIRSCLCVPVWADNRILGMLILDRGFVDPFTADDLDLVTVVGYQAALAIERARFLERAAQAEEHRRSLARHFRPEMVSLVVSQEQVDRDPLEPQVRDDVTVLLAEAPELTALAGRLPPAELAALLRDHLPGLSDAVLEERGAIDRFQGGGLVAIFGAPFPQPDGAARALRAAAAMLSRVEEANRHRPEDRRLSLRVGVGTGRATCGRLGPHQRSDFTAIGEAVEIAQQLAAMAAPGTVYASRTTVDQAGGAFSAQDMGRRVLRGRAAPLEVLQVTGPLAVR